MLIKPYPQLIYIIILDLANLFSYDPCLLITYPILLLVVEESKNHIN
jgi:hypothetical protein